jgi:hypothetical protein
VALAHSLVDPVLKNLRERVNQLHASDAADAAVGERSLPPGRLLN